MNGSLNRTCSLSSTSANQSCSTSIYGGNYAAGTYVSINAKVVGTGGEYQAVWTPLTYVAIATDAASNNNQTSSQGVSVWQWTDPNVSTIANNQNVTYTVTAQHPNGLNRIEIWVNGSVRQTCSLAQTSSNQTCSYTIYGGNYPVGTQIAFNAKAVGRDGEYQAAWTPLMYLTVTDASGAKTIATGHAPSISRRRASARRSSSPSGGSSRAVAPTRRLRVCSRRRARPLPSAARRSAT